MKIIQFIIFQLLIGMSSVAFAIPQLEGLNYARFYSATDPRVAYACENFNGVACHGSAQVPGTNWTIDYESQGTAHFGILRDMASVSMRGDGSLGTFPSFVSVGARSGYRDGYTIFGGEGAGIVTFTFNVTGIAGYATGASADALFQWVPVVNGADDYNQALGFGIIDGKAMVDVPFIFGQKFEGILFFYALAQVFVFDAPTHAFADYSHTAILGQIDVHDAHGTLVTDFAIASESGTAYTADGLVPEPGSLALLAAGLAAWGWRRGIRPA